jgi:hypothetical protein
VVDTGVGAEVEAEARVEAGAEAIPIPSAAFTPGYLEGGGPLDQDTTHK